jgi:hypothetical protein
MLECLMGQSSLVHPVLYGARYQKGKSSEVEADFVVVKEQKSRNRSKEIERKSKRKYTEEYTPCILFLVVRRELKQKLQRVQNSVRDSYLSKSNIYLFIHTHNSWLVH